MVAANSKVAPFIKARRLYQICVQNPSADFLPHFVPFPPVCAVITRCRILGQNATERGEIAKTLRGRFHGPPAGMTVRSEYAVAKGNGRRVTVRGRRATPWRP